jgi:hypothetical protein
VIETAKEDPRVKLILDGLVENDVADEKGKLLRRHAGNESWSANR